MRTTRPDLAALAVCALALLGIIVLAGLHVALPEILTTAALISLSAGVGIATQTVTGPAAPAAASEPVAAAEVAADVAGALASIPTQASAAPAPVATHAP